MKRLLAVTALLASPLVSAAEPLPMKPNIVYFICDDLGYGEIQALNPARGMIATPHVDRLTREGMVFTDAHGASAVCTPTRYGLMTGRYPWRTRLQQGVMQDDARSLIAAGRLTVPQLLRDQGYHTAAFGKWHLGFTYEGVSAKESNVAVGTKVIDSPVTRGFDYYYGFHHSAAISTVVENDRVVDRFEPVRMLPELTTRATAYIRERAGPAKNGQPFFLYFPINSPHSPVVPSPRFKGKSGLNEHADFVMETDWAFGEVLKALEESGLVDNTLVVFTSDNGTSAPTADAKALEARGHFPSGPFRGYKSDLWDGGHRVPFIVRWPGVVAAGSTNDQLVCLNDFMATLAELFGITLPPNAGEDSFSILPLLRGGHTPVRESVVHHSFYGFFAIRDRECKYVVAAGSGGWTLKEADAASQQQPPVQLYNLREDVGEQINLQAEQPERVKAMHRQLRQLVDVGRSTPGPKQPNDAAINLRKK